MVVVVGSLGGVREAGVVGSLGGVCKAITIQRTTVLLFSWRSDRFTNVDSDDERSSSSIEGHRVHDKGELDKLCVMRYEV
jgi:hypothetical protein